MLTKRDLRKVIRKVIGNRLLVLASNREPYIHIYKEGKVDYIRPVGGAVTALDPVMRACGGVWVASGSGPADKKVVDRKGEIRVPPERPKYTLKRIWLTKEEEDGYYFGFSNEAIWPLCHITYTRPVFDESDWRYYEKVNEKFAILSGKLQKSKFDNQLQLAGQTAGQLANIAGKESAAGKALAVVGATINTYAAAAAALAPPPIGAGPVFGPILAGTAIATGLANVRKIVSTPSPKAAKGGIFGGNLHSGGGNKGYFEDGTQIEVERDEAFVVINRNSTAMMNRLSDINEMGGGVPFAKGGQVSFADGGVAIDGISGGVDAENDSANQLTTILENQPAPVVVVQDINEVQGSTASVEQRAIL